MDQQQNTAQDAAQAQQSDQTQAVQPMAGNDLPQTAAPQGLLNPEQKDTLLKELGLENLPDDQKEKLMQTMIDAALSRIFNRILPSLTKEDLQMMTDLQLRPDADQAVNQYLVGRVPNLDAIAREEIEAFRQEMKDSVATIKAALPAS